MQLKSPQEALGAVILTNLRKNYSKSLQKGKVEAPMTSSIHQPFPPSSGIDIFAPEPSCGLFVWGELRRRERGVC